MPCYGPPPCAPTNGRPGFPFGFLGAGGGRLPKARRGRVFVVQFFFFFWLVGCPAGSVGCGGWWAPRGRAFKIAERGTQRAPKTGAAHTGKQATRGGDPEPEGKELLSPHPPANPESRKREHAALVVCAAGSWHHPIIAALPPEERNTSSHHHTSTPGRRHTVTPGSVARWHRTSCPLVVPSRQPIVITKGPCCRRSSAAIRARQRATLMAAVAVPHC